jgi:tRNA threonylcarbamoyladenosine biosynthesis protein TsaE
MVTTISHSPAETESLGAALAHSARQGLLVGLVGDLGSGKTQFVKGFARGLGVREPVRSPTFALVHLYEAGRLPLWHIDLYRLESNLQIITAGLEEYFTPEGVAVVEWWDRWRGRAPDGMIRVEFECLNESERRISYDDSRA